jgi:hypothetical protein
LIGNTSASHPFNAGTRHLAPGASVTNASASDPTEGASINNVRAGDSVQSARPSRHAKTVRIQKTKPMAKQMTKIGKKHPKNRIEPKSIEEVLHNEDQWSKG